MNRRHEPLDPEERALARLLDAAGDEGPSPQVDARILAAARQAQPTPATHVGRPLAGTSGARRPRRRLPLALGLAASVTLAVGVAWQLREPPQPASAPADAAFDPGLGATAEPVQAPSAMDRLETAPEEAGANDMPVAAPTIASEPASPATVQRSTQPAQKAERQTGTVPMEQPARQREREAAAAAASARSAERAVQTARRAEAAVPTAATEMRRLTGTPPTADAYASPPPPPMPPSPPAPAAPAPPAAIAATAQGAPVEPDPRNLSELQVDAEPSAPAAFADHASTPAQADAATLEDDARLPATQWLQRIRERRQRGQTDLARASLARFVVTHPDAAIPEDLRPLLP